jgi:photosystem II stability/assembly factor-like uncharacterized protein
MGTEQAEKRTRRRPHRGGSRGLGALLMLAGVLGVLSGTQLAGHPAASAADSHATLTWVGSGNWSVAANWSPAEVPANGDSLVFPEDDDSSTVGPATNDLSGLVVDNVSVVSDGNGCSGPISVGGNAFTVTGNLIAGMWCYNSPPLPIDNDIVLAKGVHNTSGFNFAGVLSGRGGLNFDGATILSNSDPNTYKGGTTFDGSGGVRATLESQSAPAIPTQASPIDVPAGDSLFDEADGAIAGSDSVTVDVGGVFEGDIDPSTLATPFASLTVSGGLWLQGGLEVDSLRLNSSANLEVGGSYYEYDGGSIVVNGPVSLAGQLEFAVNGQTVMPEELALIENTSTRPTTGTFSGYPQGSTISTGATPASYTVGYGVGATGGDVVLTDSSSTGLTGDFLATTGGSPTGNDTVPVDIDACSNYDAVSFTFGYTGGSKVTSADCFDALSLQPGTYTVTVTVTSAVDQTATTSQTVQVVGVSAFSALVYGSSSDGLPIVEIDECSSSGAASYAWKMVSRTAQFSGSNSGNCATVTQDVPTGTYTITLAITEPDGTQVSSSQPFDASVPPSCPVTLAADGTPEYVVLLAGGIGTSTTAGQYDPLSYQAGNLGPNGYCTPGGNDQGKAAPLQSILETFAPVTQDGQTTSLTNTLAQEGAVILPFSYGGATLSGNPASPTLVVNGAGSDDPGDILPPTEATVMEAEVESVHSTWPNATIVIAGHSNGGLVDELWWDDYGRFDVSNGIAHDGVIGVFSLDSPISGVQDGLACDAAPALTILCQIGNVGPLVAAYYSWTWINRASIDAQILSADNAGQFIPIGTFGDPLYHAGDWPNAGMISQILFADGCAGGPGETCTPAGLSYNSGCSVSFSMGVNGHSWVKNCPGAINYIGCMLENQYPGCALNIASQASSSVKLDPTNTTGDASGARAVGPHEPPPPPAPFPAVSGSISPTVATPGQDVTISGSGFGDQTGTVTLLSANSGHFVGATIDSWSANQITFEVPPEAASGPVILQPADQSAPESLTGVLTVLTPANGVAHLTATAGSPPRDGDAASVTVTATDADGDVVPGAIVNLTTSQGVVTGTTDRDGQAILALNGAGTEAFTVYSGAVSTTVSVAWTKAPAWSLRLRSPTDTPAVGQSVTITATLTDGSGHLVANQSVDFQGVGPAGDTLSKSTATTNAAGDASVVVTTNKDAPWTIGAVADGGAITASLVLSPATPHSSAGESWSTQQPYPGLVQSVSGVSCATNADCWAVGATSSGAAAVVATTNGGSSWRSQTLPRNIEYLDSLSCPNSADCWAVGGTTSGTAAVVGTTNGGRTWQSLAVPNGLGGLSSVSCPNSADCWAVGDNTSFSAGAVVATTDGGRRWTPELLPNKVEYLDGVSCPSRADCWAVGGTSSGAGAVVGTTNGGSTWKSQALPSGIAALNGVSCRTNVRCLAVGDTPSLAGAVVGTTNGGSTWKSRAFPRGIGTLRDVSCATSSNCWAVGSTASGRGAVVASTNGGSTWKSQALPRGISYLNGVSCRTSARCSAVGSTASGGGAVVATTDGGSTWKGQTLPRGISHLNGVSCRTSARCWAVGSTASGAGAVVATTNGGSTWKGQTLPNGIGSLAGVTCPTSDKCWAVGSTASGGGAVVATTNGGSTWRSQVLPSGLGGLRDVSCPSSTDCRAVGDTASGNPAVVVTTNSGSTWKSKVLPRRIAYLDGVSCPTSADCWAVGGTSSGAAAIVATTNGGITWKSRVLPSGISYLEGVSCPTSADCRAVGGTSTGGAAVVATTNGGITWRSQVLPSGLGGLSGVSCPTRTDCWGVGSTGGGGAVILSTTPTIESFSPTTGRPGTTVTVNGINLSGATAVSFDGTRAKVTRDSATKLVTAVPHGAKTGKIAVTTPLGQATSSTVFSVT